MDMMWYRRRGLMVTPHIERVTGAIAPFNSYYNKIPIKGLICNIDPIQSGSGDPSPDNVRPISGQTGLSVTRCGKNLLEWINQSTTIRGVTFTVNDDGSILCNGTATDGDASFYSKTPYDVPIKPGDYILSGCPADGSSTTFFLNETLYAKSDYGNGVTINANVAKPNIRVRVVIRNGYTADGLLFKPMLRLSGTDATFEPYKGSTYSVNWETEAGTVYGGTLDVVSGKLIMDRVKETKTWEAVGSATALTSVTRKRWNFEHPAKYINTDASNDLLCNCIGTYNISYSLDTVHMYIGNENYAYIYLPTNTEDSTIIELSYSIAEPIEYQLSPQEVKTLLDTNSIWCDSGDVTVDYWKWGK